MPDVIDAPAAEPLTPTAVITNFMKGNLPLDSDDAPKPPTDAPTPPPKPDPSPAPKPTPPPVTDDAKPPTNAQRWKEFTAARDEGFKKRDEEISTLRAEMKKLSEQAAKLPSDDPEKAALKKEREELSRQLWTVSRERHPEFQNKYDKQIDSALNMVQQIVGGETGKKLAKILKSGDPETRDGQIEELLEEAGAFKMSRVAPIINTLDQLQAARTQELNVSKEEFDRMVSEHQASEKAKAQQQAKQQQAMIEQMFNTGLASLRDKEKGIPELMERDGDDAWNADLKNRLAEARKIISGEGDPDRVVRAVLREAAFDAVQKDRDTAREENGKLKAQLDAIQKANPGLRSTPPARSINEPPNRLTATPQQAFANYAKLVTAPDE